MVFFATITLWFVSSVSNEMKKFVYFLSFIVTLLPSNGQCSSESLLNYLDIEKSFISDLEDYIEHQESVLQYLRKKLFGFKVEHEEALENKEKYFSSELNEFLIVKRLATEMNMLSDKTKAVAVNFKDQVDSYNKLNKIPTKSDLNKAATKISQLQISKNLETKNLAKGFVGDIKIR